jgi:hypothetical protein
MEPYAGSCCRTSTPGYGVTQAAAELFSRAPAGVGYLLKDRVADVSEFIDAIAPSGAGRDGA